MPKLIIFDCDGTLVDSEYMYNSITAELLNEIGFPEYTPELCLELFAGQSWSTIRADLEIRHQAKLPDDIIERYIRIANRRMSDDFSEAPGAGEVVASLSKTHTLCVASNGERNNVLKSLEVTGLLPYFSTDRIFTKIQVPRPKPAPDLFLFACEQMKCAPAEALVIEDSIAGVRAAVAAGIRVLGYIGTAHDPALARRNLEAAGAQAIIEQLIHINAQLEY
jgi:HAD superfamily hydrolase (TIGR01509 family)